MTPIDTILARLETVRQRQSGQWSARCPACNSNGPKLSVRETPEGAVLLHCFKGCEVSAIVSAVGMQLQDLFPPRDVPPGAPKRMPRLLTASQANQLMLDELTFAAFAIENAANGVELSEANRARLRKAVGTLNLLRDEIRGSQNA